jgi:folate-dependent phosphoribosylglycinamide formyltransferase PurN
LHARIQIAEHALLPAVVSAIATGQIVLDRTPRHVAQREPYDASEAFVWPRLRD